VTGEPFVFTAETNIADAMDLDPRVVEAFQALGLKCPGKPGRESCVAAEKETLAEAALYHEKDLAGILGALNALRIPRKA